MRHHQHHPIDQRGFAIVVTVSILLLLAIIAVGLLTLSTVTLRSSSRGSATNEARANARLGLVLAIGELQRSLGPDRRVSAPAGILDETPETADIDGVKHPHWTAVWSTELDNADSTWPRNDNHGGLRDLRTTNSWEARTNVENYLVSGNEGGRKRNGTSPWLDALSSDLAANDSVKLVGPGSVLDSQQEVSVKRVPLQTSPSLTANESGAYAFWIGDLGTKANISQTDAHVNTALDGGAQGLERVLHAQDVQPEVIENLGSIDANEADRIISHQTLALLSKVNGDGVKQRFHDITTYSRSTLSNVRDGGLQRDLTAYLQSSGNIPHLQEDTQVLSEGLRDADALVGLPNSSAARRQGLNWNSQRYRDIAPRFGLIRRWNQDADDRPFADPSSDMVTPARLRDRRMLRSLNDGVNVYDKAHMRPAAFVPYDRPNLTPVLVEGSIYYNLATFSQQSGNSTVWVLRLCLYPRVAIWNPHSVELKLPQTVAELFVNGNKQVRLKRRDGSQRDVTIPFGRGSIGGTRHPRHYRGTVLWTLPAVTLAPGETLVFSPDKNAKYDLNTISNNTLSPNHAPDAANYYYQDMTRKHSQTPRTFLEWPKGGRGSGADNNLMALKDGGSGRVTDASFDNLPTIVYVNPSLQAGGSDELPLQWDSQTTVPVYRLSTSNAKIPPNAVPDVRTRDGFRLRWWEEHPSNIFGSGKLNRHPEHLQTALMANWNPRAGYFCRTPWENISSEPPYFYGAYTRDLFDQDVSWASLAPRSKKGRMLGFPFGPPQEGPDSIVLFETPSKELSIPSLGYLRHLKVSEFGWHPSYAIGNSLADPRVGRISTSPIHESANDRADGGWNKYAFGWDSGRGNQGYWAMLTRQILFDTPINNNVVYDQSFELNYNLWDDFFFSTGSPDEKEKFFLGSQEEPLPNGRVGLFSTDGSADSDITDFHRAASRLSLDGGFNVHSISRDAWKALLSSTRDTGFGEEGTSAFPRVLNPEGDQWLGENANDDEIWNGFRSLSDDEIARLADELVIEVKRRAPFFGLSDFVNRRLKDDETGSFGPLQTAINAADLNAALDQQFPLDNSSELPDVGFENISDATRLDQTLKPASTAWGLPGYLTQGDLLQTIGSSLRARSDSFVIRSYGESTDPNGKVLARAWCEAVVQRVPTPLNPDSTGLNPILDPATPDFGRRFRLISFRWLTPDEV